MPRSKALCMRAMASFSVNLPHQPVEMVHMPNPTSETFTFDLRRSRYFIKKSFYTARIQFGKFEAVNFRTEFFARKIGVILPSLRENPGSGMFGSATQKYEFAKKTERFSTASS